MSRLFSIHEAAEAEINEAADFYDLESPGLGNVFISLELGVGLEAEAEKVKESRPLAENRLRKVS